MFGSIRRRPRTAGLVGVLALLTLPLGACSDIVGIGSRDLDVIWPRSGATLHDFETLRVRVRGYDLDDYDVYWYIDGGVERRMYDEWRDNPPHKAYEVDTWDWYWNGRGPYTLGFVAEDWRGRRIGERKVRVYVD